ncbi:Fur family transcriptional regulator [Chondromyces crocatus]|uniref:Fur family transcriptional regulator n=1 Tax=Chondromyces crocatus TaxID=52 RepID=A0A0K1E5P2_CHOCO|nr:transcriptional repressor [Chondromyces crocatus]AKT36191.1 Fur family transcriptional regulator [Chondromyces crocatus]
MVAVSHAAKPLTLDELRAILRDKGLRATTSRVAVLEFLRQATTPVSHAELAAELTPRGWDRATLYRNLIDLTEVGLVRRADVGDHLWRFELLKEGSGHRTDEHPHFVCDACGDILCLPDESVQIKAARGVPRSLRRRGVQIQLKGRCDRCIGA